MFRIVRLPKGRGGYRTIYVPDAATKVALRLQLPTLEKVQDLVCHPLWVHGFRVGRNPWTNAVMHIGREHTLSVDIEDFFDHVTPELVKRAAPLLLLDQVKDKLDLYFPDGAARQGLPTSPLFANIAFAPFDWMIVQHLRAIARAFDLRNLVYTRYADDITVSYDADLRGEDRTFVPKKLAAVIAAVIEPHFRLSDRKRKYQPGGRRYRHITGISVGRDELKPTRRTKRRIRAARHQHNEPHVRGLEGWCRPVFPSPFCDELMRCPGYDEARAFVTLTLARQQGLRDPKESSFRRRGRRRFAR